MNRTEYKNKFNKEHYERINISVPKGMKDVIKGLAHDKHLSLNAYILELVRKDQEGIFDTMQLSDFNRNRILTIKGNMHDGYDVFLKDGRTFHCRTKLQIRQYLAQDSQSLAQDRQK
jgi:hypothetical protein